jgi:hypothetical protein
VQFTAEQKQFIEALIDRRLIRLRKRHALVVVALVEDRDRLALECIDLRAEIARLRALEIHTVGGTTP